MNARTMAGNGAGWKRRVVVLALPLLIVTVFIVMWRRTVLMVPGNIVPSGPPRAEFILAGSVYDLGYNYRHYLGHRAISARLMSKIDSRVHQGISPATFQEKVQSLCQSGASLIFSTDELYKRSCRQLAQENPDVVFLQFTASPKWMAPQRLANLSTYGIRDWEGAYVCGVIAGHAIPGASAFGFVAPHPGPPTPWVANAFALGCQRANPHVRVEIFYTGSWHDPDKEIEALKEMSSRQISAVYFLTNFPATAFKVAEESGMRVLSHYSDLSSFAPSSWITGCLWHWSSLYEQVTHQALSGERKSGSYWGGLRERYISLGPFGPDVPGSAMQKAKDIIEQIISGRLSVFSGPVYDNRGGLRIGQGEILSDSETLSCDWLVGVVSEYKVIDGAAEPLD
ncbi:MAG: BMP family ABC transporter substrate-binding protein [Phycisphaerales bacterium]|nr:MAG: BMP family ABC transporter substrate-binding protein [Phycisphaerales bacterium]